MAVWSVASGENVRRGLVPFLGFPIADLSEALSRIIAGNHDLTLHTEWYEHAYERWHRLLGKQVR